MKTIYTNTKNSLLKSVVKTIAFALIFAITMLNAVSSFGQVTVTNPTNTTPNLAATYTSLANAITGLNAVTAVSGPVTITLAASNPQTAPVGGYSITAAITGGSATNTITIAGSGNTITAPAQTAGSLNDAIFKIIGTDFITISGFTMQENAANTTTAAGTNNMTEWGVALLERTGSTIDGSQSNTIQNNTISLSRLYQNSFGIYSNVNHTPTAVTTSVPTTNATGANSFNKYYTNTISNVNFGIVLIGSSALTAVGAQDNGNDIGGASAGTGNTITNSGGIGVAVSGYVGLTANNYLIFSLNQFNDNISFNNITSATGAAQTGTIVLGGILKNYSGTTIQPTGTITTTINNNTVTLTNAPAASATGAVIGINNQGLSPFLSTATVNINNNIVQNCVNGGANITTGGFTGITNLSLPGTLNMNSNSIIGNAISGATATSGTFNCMSNTGAAGTVNMNSNIIRNNSSTAASGQYQGITNSGAVVTALSINNNQLGNATGGFFSSSVASSGSLLGISTSAGAATCALAITGNDIRGITYNTAASATQTYITNSAATLSQNISSNTFTNLNVNTTGSVTFISNNVALPTGGSLTASSNSIVTGFNKTGAGGTVTLYLTTNTPSSVTTTTKTAQNNNFSNITVTGATTVAGWMDIEGTSAGLTKNITNNTFSNWTCGSSAVTALQVGYCLGSSAVSSNTISNITGSGSITGISLLSNNVVIAGVNSNSITGLSSTGAGGAVTAISSASATTTINNNTINNLSSTSTTATVVGITSSGATTTNISGNTINTLSCVGTTSGVTNGIMVTAGTTVNVFKNKIYDLSTTGAFTTTPGVNGIVLSGGTTVNTYNNIIGLLTAPTANSTDAVRGISVTSTTALSTYNVYYNTIRNSSSSTGTNYGTTGIFHAASATGTTASLNLRNNIVAYLSTFSGTGQVVAFRRSAGTAGMLANYASTSNNNLFFAGTPSPNNLIYADGTSSAQTLAAYKAGVFTAGTIATRDASSVTENPTFISNVGSAATFLHINTSVPTAVESGGAGITGFADDFDGDTRSTTGATDIGADEGTFTVLPLCTGTPATSTISGAAAVCSGAGTTLSLSTTYTDLLLTYQWKSSTVQGGPYNTILGTTSTQATGNLTVATYYICEVTCTNSGGSTMTTVEKSVLVNPTPTVGVTQSGSIYCGIGAGAVQLSGTGAATYSWSPVTNLFTDANATAAYVANAAAASVFSTPTATRTYTVTGTSANGCTATAVATAITVSNTTVSAVGFDAVTPVCAGSYATLKANVVSTTLSGASAYSFSGSTITYAAVTGTDVGASGQGDDVAVGNLPIGFTFTYNGINQSVFAAASNGFIELGSTLTYANNTAAGWIPSSNSLATRANVIAPLWDDNNTTGGTIIYNTSGTAPNRVLTVQWTGIHVAGSGSATNPTINMQVKLYETTNVIQFIYGSTSATLSSPTISIGLSSAVGNFLSVTPVSPSSSSTFSTTVENASVSNSALFPSGTMYTFTPPATAAPTFVWSPNNTLDNELYTDANGTAAYNGSSSVNPVFAKVNAATPYTVTIATGGCSFTRTVSTSLSTTPLAATPSVVNKTTRAVVSGSVCPSTAVNIKSNITGGCPTFSYVWSTSQGGASIGTLDSLDVAPTVTTTYWVRVSGPNSQLVENSITVTVFAVTNVGLSASASTFCTPSGTAVALTASNATSYVWSPAAGLSATTGASVNASPTATTTYTVTATNANGCVTTANTQITVSNSVSFSSAASANPATVCPGSISTLSATASANPFSVLKITEVTLNRTGTGATLSYPAWLTGADIVEISNLSANSVDVSGLSLFDYGSASATSNHTFSFPSGTSIPANSVAIVVLGTGTNDAAYRYFNATGSTDSYSSGALVGIVLKNGATIIDAVGLNSGYTFAAGTGVTATDWSGFAPSASGFAGTIRTASTDNNIGADWSQSAATSLPQTQGVYNTASNYTTLTAPSVNYNWYLTSDLTTSQSTTSTFITSALTTTNFTVIADANGCSASSTVNLTISTATLVASTPTVNIRNTATAVSGSVCPNTALTIKRAFTGGCATYSYKWGTTAGASDLGTADTLNVAPTAASTTYFFTVTDNSGTSASSSVTITTFTVSSVAVSSQASTFCSPNGTAVALNGTATNVNTYNWSPSTGLSATNTASVNATPSATTKYYLTGVDVNSCSSIDSVTITVNPSISIVTSSTPTILCAGSTAQLNAVASPVNSSVSAYGFVGSTTTYSPISGAGTTTLGSGVIGDDVGIGNLDIGFNFNYNGSVFTKFGARSNGLIELGQTSATLSGFSANALASTANCIAPLWDDNNTTGGSIITSTTGTAPNRILTVQWTGMHVAGGGSATNPTIDLQLQLFETSNIIKFIYGTTSATLSSPTISIGLSGAVGNFLSVTPASPSSNSTVSSSSENISVSNSALFPSGTMYTFTPPTVAASTVWYLASNLSNAISSTVSPSGTTNYTVVASSNGCSATANYTLNTAALPTITASANVSICNGGSTSLSASGALTGGTYSWNNASSLSASNTTPVLASPTTTTTYTVTGTTATASGACSNTAQVTVTVNNPVVITGHPSNQSGTFVDIIKIGVAATGTGLTYQWQESLDGTAWDNITATGNPSGSSGSQYSQSAIEIYTGFNTDTLRIDENTGGFNTGSYYRCIVLGTAPCGSVISTAAQLTIASVGFASQPTNVILCNSGNQSFSVTTSGIVTSYQWQEKTPAGSFVNISNGGVYSNATTSTLNITGATTALDGYSYRCILDGGVATSNAATLNVRTAISINTQPANASNCYTGGNSNFTISAVGTGLTYQWQYATSVNGTYANVVNATPLGATYTGATTATINVATTANTPATTYFYRCVLSGTSPCAGVNSSAVSLTVYTMSKPTVAATTVTVNANTIPSLNATANSTPVAGSIRWYNARTGGTLVNNGALYTLPRICVAGTSTTYYVEEFSGTCLSPRDSSTLIVSPLITSDPANGLICTVGGNADLTANVSGATSYAWTGNNLSANNILTVTATPSTTSIYSLTVGTSLGCGNISSTFNVGVIPGSALVPTANPTSGCSNSTVQLNSGLTGSNFAVTSITHAPATVPGSGVTTLVSGGTAAVTLSGGTLDDGGWGNIPIGFNYNYFGVNNTRLAIGTNGVIGFGNITDFSTTGLGFYDFISTNGTVFPNNSNPANIIGIFASDRDLRTTGTIRYWNDGIAPTRRFIVQYLGVPRWSGSSNPVTVQCILYETTGVVEIHVLSSTAGAGAATIGLQDITKTIGATAPGRTAFTTDITTPEAWRFNPPATYTYVWAPATNLSSSTITNPVFGSGASQGAYTYNVKVTNPNTGCVADSSVSFNIVGTPAAPSATANFSYCQNATVSALTASVSGSNTLRWYTVPTGGTASTTAPTPSTTTVGTIIYYVSQITAEGCESGRTAISVAVIAAPSSPTATSPITICQFATANALTANATANHTLNWYTTSTGGSPTPTATPSTSTAASTIYYVSQTSNTSFCESGRTSVVVGVFAAPSNPTVTTPVNYCVGSSSIALTASTVVGNTVNWYTQQIGGTASATAPSPSTATAGATSFYVSQTSTQGCESGRSLITVNINANVNASLSVSASTTSICNVSSVTFTVNPTNGGSSPVYAWYLNGGLVSGQNAATYVLSSPVSGDSVYATMSVSGVSCLNNATATSDNGIKLTSTIATPTLSISASATSICAGTSVTFTSVSSNGGASPTYKWYVNGNVVSGQNGANFTSTSFANNDQVTAELTSSIDAICLTTPTANSNTVSITHRTPTSISVAPSSLSQCAGTQASFSVSALGDGSLTYQWRRNLSNVTGNASAQTSNLLINNIAAANTGSYTVVVTGGCGSVTSTAATLALSSVTSITTQPIARTVCSGSDTTFTVVGAGSGTLTYQWRKDNIAITGNASATTARLVLLGVSSNDVANYSVIVTGDCGSVTSNSVGLSVNPATTISVQPVSLNQCANTNVSLSVQANGTGTIAYQWRLNGVNVSGANVSGGTSSILSIANATNANAGKYTVSITSTCGSITSDTAIVSLNATTTITTQPTSVAACIGSNSFFTVQASGSGTLSYQWRKGNTTLTGQTNATLNLSNVGLNDVANYSVIVTSSCGSTTSNTVALTLKYPTTSTTSASVCTSSLPYSWNGLTFTGAGSQTANLTNAAGCDSSATLNLTIDATAVGGTPSSLIACYGFQLNNNVNLVGSVGSIIKWQKSADITFATGVVDIANTTTTLLPSEVGVITSVTYLRALVQSGSCVQVYSNIGTLTPVSTIAGTVSSQNVCVTGSGSVPSSNTVLSNYQGSIIKWQKSTDATFATGVTDIASTNFTLSGSSVGSTSATTYVRALVQNATCSQLYSTAGVLTVYDGSPSTVSISTTGGSTICSGSNTVFTAVASNPGTSPVYVWKRNGTVVGTNSPTLAFAAGTLSTGNVITCDVTSSNPCAFPTVASSNALTLTVTPSPAVGAIVNAKTGAAITATSLCNFGDTLFLVNYTPNGVWSSSNTSVATVALTPGGTFNRSAYVLPKARGGANIVYSLLSSGCTSTSSFALKVAPVAAPASITGGSGAVCVGSTLQLSNATPGGVWSSTAASRATVGANTGVVTGASGGTTVIRYTVSNDSGCNNFASYNLVSNVQPAVPSIAFGPAPQNPQGSGGFCNNRRFTLRGTPTEGVWTTPANGVLTIRDSITPITLAKWGLIVNTNVVGSSSITYTVANAVTGCTNFRTISGTVVACASRGVDLNAPTIREAFDFTLYPNPAKGRVSFNVDFAEAGSKVVVTDMYGKQVKTQSMSIGTNQIDIANLSKGFYLVSVITNDGRTTKKLIIE